MKVRVLMSYLKTMDPEAEVKFQVPNKETRYNVRHVEESVSASPRGVKKTTLLRGD